MLTMSFFCSRQIRVQTNKNLRPRAKIQVLLNSYFCTKIFNYFNLLPWWPHIIHHFCPFQNKWTYKKNPEILCNVTCWIGYMENREWILWSWRSSSFAVSSSSGGVRSRRDGSSGSGLHDCKSKMLLKKINKQKIVCLNSGIQYRLKPYAHWGAREPQKPEHMYCTGGRRQNHAVHEWKPGGFMNKNLGWKFRGQMDD